MNWLRPPTPIVVIGGGILPKPNVRYWPKAVFRR
jgi:hypothetical protein